VEADVDAIELSGTLRVLTLVTTRVGILEPRDCTSLGVACTRHAEVPVRALRHERIEVSRAHASEPTDLHARQPALVQPLPDGRRTAGEPLRGFLDAQQSLHDVVTLLYEPGQLHPVGVAPETRWNLPARESRRQFRTPCARFGTFNDGVRWFEPR
jgi:hypothetical protein